MDDIKIPKTPNTPTKILPTEEPSLEALRKEPESINLAYNDNDEVQKSNTIFTKPVRKHRRFKPSKKLIIIVFALLLVSLAGYGAYIYLHKEDVPVEQNQQTTVKEDEPETPPPPPTSPLTGRVVATTDIANRPITGIMIENSPESRPQSGLYQADMVYEAIAEGGVTRFLAVFQESQPDRIGPVRSARPYYLDYIAGLDGSFGHVGGSPEALQDIKSLPIKDLDQFYNASAYSRITGRYAPHNVYTDFIRLDTLNKQKGYTSSTFTPLMRKIDVPQTPTATSISLNLSGPNYNAQFSYDLVSNSYLRSQANSPHKDEISGKQINPKVVVALVVNKTYDPDGYHTDYSTTGSGKVYVFQDGIVSEGTWYKKDRKASLELKDIYGTPLALNTGQTWITLVASSGDVKYSTQ